jgi:hypothetical protein
MKTLFALIAMSCVSATAVALILVETNQPSPESFATIAKKSIVLPPPPPLVPMPPQPPGSLNGTRHVGVCYVKANPSLSWAFVVDDGLLSTYIWTDVIFYSTMKGDNSWVAGFVQWRDAGYATPLGVNYWASITSKADLDAVFTPHANAIYAGFYPPDFFLADCRYVNPEPRLLGGWSGKPPMIP